MYCTFINIRVIIVHVPEKAYQLQPFIQVREHFHDQLYFLDISSYIFRENNSFVVQYFVALYFYEPFQQILMYLLVNQRLQNIDIGADQSLLRIAEYILDHFIAISDDAYIIIIA